MPASSVFPVQQNADHSSRCFQDILQTSTSTRPLTHRPSLPSNSYTSPNVARQTHSRTNSHTILSGPLTAGHRVTSRRKSLSNNHPNTPTPSMAFAVSGMFEGKDKVPALPMVIGDRRTSRSGGQRPTFGGLNTLPSPPASMPAHAHKFLGMEEGNQDSSDNAVDDQENISPEEAESSQQAARVRRASDGQPLVKEGRKFNRPEIHCDKCGKGYKHSSCLNKHMFVPLSSSPQPLTWSFPLWLSSPTLRAVRPAPLMNIARQTLC